MSDVIQLSEQTTRRFRKMPFVEKTEDFVIDLLLICGEYTSGNLSYREGLHLLISLDVMDRRECADLLNNLVRDNTYQIKNTE